MVGIRKIKKSYYARVYIPRPGKKPGEKLISLKTKMKREALVRKNEVQNYESEIQAGFNVSFPWQTTNGKVELRRYTLLMAIEDYLKSLRGDGIRKGTIDIYKLGLSHFKQAVGKSLIVSEITLNHIDKYKGEFVDLVKQATLNMDLRTIKAFLFWLQVRGRISEVPKIKIKKENKPPVYLTNKQFKEICKRVDPHFQRAFWFYRETGLRLSEPFNATLDGDFLIVESDKHKGHREHTIHLTPEEKRVYLEIRTMVSEKVRRGISTRKNAIHLYTKVFYLACLGDEKKGWERIIGRKFHSLRHTCAVRLYLKTRDIYAVMKQLGHSSVTVTEIYTKFNIRLLEQHLPDLVKSPQKQAKSQPSDTLLPETHIPIFA